MVDGLVESLVMKYLSTGFTKGQIKKLLAKDVRPQVIDAIYAKLMYLKALERSSNEWQSESKIKTKIGRFKFNKYKAKTKRTYEL